MITLLIFLLVISVLVFVHELGHFVMAKRAGMKVEEFGFGFPPRIWGKRKGGTLYSINAIPFGGFVRIFGEDGDERTAPGSFGHGTFLQKVGVIVAGVVMNVLFAAALLALVNATGLRVGVFDDQVAARATDRRIEILEVLPDSPADVAGVRPLDAIVGFRQGGVLVATDTSDAVREYAYAHAGERTTLVVWRGSSTLELPLTLRQATGPTQGPIGISLAMTGVIRYPWYTALWRGIADTALLFWATVLGYAHIFASLFVDGRLGADISGPVGIATLTGQAAQVGFSYLVQFVAMISVNLAVLNILPFPALDGGRLVLAVAEKFRGRALSHRVEGTINAIGFLILLALMVAVTVKDIVKFF